MRIIYLYCSEEVVREAAGLQVKEMAVCTADKYIIDRLKSNNHQVELLEYSENFYEEIKKIDADLIFNAADAFDGLDFHGKLLENMERTGIPFTGCNKEVTLLFTDKVKAKEFFKKCGAKTSEYQVILSSDCKLAENLSYPMIIKPSDSDASEGIDEDSVIYDEDSFKKKVSEVISRFKGIFAEGYIEGREFCVPVIFNKGEIETFPILEIDFTEHFENKPKILSFKAKWNKNTNAFKNTYSVIKQLETDVEAKIKNTAIKVFSSLDSSGYATMDLRFKDGEAYVLEVNPNPYLAVECDFIKSAKQAGLTSNEFIEKIISLNKFETVKPIISKE